MRLRLAVPDEMAVDVLVRDMERPPWSWKVEVERLSWAHAADALRNGNADLAFISPRALYSLRSRCEVVPGIALTTRGGTHCALLVYRGSLENIERIHSECDGHGADFLCELFFAAGGRPIPLSKSDRSPDTLAEREALVLSGLRALRHRPTKGLQVLDLGAAWFEMSRRPLLWGVWAGRDAIVDRALYKLLHSARTHGRRALDDIVARRFNETDFRAEMTPLLRDRTVFRLGREELAGMRELWEAGVEHGLLDGASNPNTLRFASLGRKTSCHDIAERVRAARNSNTNKH